MTRTKLSARRPTRCGDQDTDSAAVDREGSRTTAAEDAVALEIRRRRRDARLSQSVLAKRAGFQRQYISRAENPTYGMPSENLVARLDVVLEADGALVEMWTIAAQERRRRRDVAHAEQRDDIVASGSGGKGGPVDALGEGVDRRGDADLLVFGVLDPVDALDAVDALTGSVVDRYEVEGPSLLAAEVHELRKVCRSVAVRAGKGLRRRVAWSAARQAGLLAYMAVDVGRPAQAQQFATEASILAAAAGDAELLAWIKGTQSLSTYYQGRYRDALRLAEAGLRIDGAREQRARLLSNGVARAAARLGETHRVQRAVDDALEATQESGLTSCISFGPYGAARAMANAATAHLAVGRFDDVLAMTGALDGVVQNSEWSRALVRLDAASAHARRPDADLDHAAALGTVALHESQSNPIASIGARAEDLADDLDRRAGSSTPVAEFRSALHTWRAASGLGA